MAVPKPEDYESIKREVRAEFPGCLASQVGWLISQLAFERKRSDEMQAGLERLALGTVSHDAHGDDIMAALKLEARLTLIRGGERV
jgi:hypothetical protein